MGAKEKEEVGFVRHPKSTTTSDCKVSFNLSPRGGRVLTSLRQDTSSALLAHTARDMAKGRIFGDELQKRPDAGRANFDSSTRLSHPIGVTFTDACMTGTPQNRPLPHI